MIPISLNGKIFNIPQQGENPPWGEDTTDYLVELANVLSLTTNEGDIPLTNKVINNNQSVTDVTELLFSSALVKSFTVEGYLTRSVLKSITEFNQVYQISFTDPSVGSTYSFNGTTFTEGTAFSSVSALGSSATPESNADDFIGIFAVAGFTAIKLDDGFTVQINPNAGQALITPVIVGTGIDAISKTRITFATTHDLEAGDLFSLITPNPVITGTPSVDSIDQNSVNSVLISNAISAQSSVANTSTITQSESVVLLGKYSTNPSWNLIQYSNGNCGVTFSITTSGQIQYTSTNFTGISGYTGDFKFFAKVI